MKEMHYPNGMYANIDVPYVQYSQPSSGSNVVSNKNVIERHMFTLFLHRVFMNNVTTQQSMHL